MAKVRVTAAALALLGWAGLAHALGLGEIEVSSRLNQPLSALIPISAAKPSEIDTLVVELATNEEFERAGLERPEFLSALRFEVKDKAIRVFSKDIAREPFVSFLVSVRWDGGRLLREYTVLLDPPTLAQPKAPVPAPSAAAAIERSPPPPPAPEPAATPAAPPAAPPAPSAPKAGVPAPAAAARAPSPAGGTYGPVKPQETLWSIAFSLRPDPAITMDQVQVAIYEANPEAFDEGRLNALMKGVVLKIPTAAQMRAVDPAAAKAQVAAARSGVAVARPAAPAAPAPAPTPAPPPPAVAEAPVATPPPTPDAVAPTPGPEPETAQAPPPAPEAAPELAPEAAPATPDPVEPPPAAEAPAEASPPVAEPPPEEGPGLVAELLEHPLLLPVAGGLLVLLLLVAGVKAGRDKFAQWQYARASRKAEQVAPALLTGADDVTQVADSGTEQAFQEVAAEPAPVQQPAFAATQAMPPPVAQTMQQTMQQTLQQTMAQEPPQAQTGPGKVDFDVTGNFASETVQINLDAGDPVSEAEFHRAYGLYDEAALLLKQALEKDPKRTDARVKLAEIYFEASKKAEFVDTAKALKGQLPDAEWQKIALLGTQIAPDNELFAGGSEGAGGTVDLSFDEPATPVPGPGATTQAAAAPAQAAPAEDTGMLDFKLEDVQLPETQMAPEASAAPAAAAPAAEGALEFDLGSLTLDSPGEAAGSEAPTQAAPAAPPTQAGAADELKLDLGDFDLAPAAATPEAPAGQPGTDEVVEIGSPDLSIEESTAGAGDEASTKLDLARAYMDMGDNDMARSLLNEVTQQGNDQQKKEAQELLKRVPA
jgi:pilus assembly protein FimV